jgi:hypothetical protein
MTHERQLPTKTIKPMLENSAVCGRYYVEVTAAGHGGRACCHVYA